MGRQAPAGPVHLLVARQRDPDPGLHGLPRLLGPPRLHRRARAVPRPAGAAGFAWRHRRPDPPVLPGLGAAVVRARCGAPGRRAGVQHADPVRARPAADASFPRLGMAALGRDRHLACPSARNLRPVFRCRSHRLGDSRPWPVRHPDPVLRRRADRRLHLPRPAGPGPAFPAAPAAGCTVARAVAGMARFAAPSARSGDPARAHRGDRSLHGHLLQDAASQPDDRHHRQLSISLSCPSPPRPSRSS